MPSPVSLCILSGMETFGQKVRYAIESQELPLDEVARATGLGIEHIQALPCR